MRLDRRDRPLVERPQVGVVMVRQREEPAEAIELPVIGVPGRRAGIRLGRELGSQPAQGDGGLVGERGDARPGHGRRSRSWLAGRAAFLSERETKGDECDATLDDQEVNGDLADAPVVVRPRGEVLVGRMFDSRQESRAPFVRPPRDEPDGLADPARTVRRVFRYGERHSSAYCAVRVYVPYSTRAHV